MKPKEEPSTPPTPVAPELPRTGSLKPWEELTIADDYMFKLVMSHKRICKHLLELGRVEKRKLCATARQFFVWQGRETAVVAELRQGFTDADRRKNGRCSVLVEFFNTP